jgi:site-specific recombinase XerD
LRAEREPSPDEVERVVSSCDPGSSVGRRDRAILLLLARPGLRAGDIVQLRLSDINWRDPEICVSGKGRHEVRLPLTQQVGCALAAYLQDGRPQTDTDGFFVRSRALLDAPVPTTRDGIRDRAMLYLCFAGGLRVSELIGLRVDDLTLHPHASILVHGKGRRQRSLPLGKETASALRAWLSVRGTVLVPELFFNARGKTMTRAGFEFILSKHARIAAKPCPSLSTKRVSRHVPRHTCALPVLQATKDLRKVSLWLGHANMQTTAIDTRADPATKLEALESVAKKSARKCP